jgi:L-asparaginase II
MLDSKILTEITRGNSFESAHRGWIAVCDKNGDLINGTHDTFPDFFARSSIKPVQALPFLMSGGMETFNFGLSELAVICSSHSGEKKHLERVEHILNTIGLKEDNLLCGTHIPYSNKVAKELIENKKEPTSLYCNCSGKHAGMLATCLMNGWDLKTYLEYDHPLQKEIRKHLGVLIGLDAEQLIWGIDGCGIPTYKFPLDKLAKIFSYIVNYENAPSEYYDSLKLINKAFIAYPDLIAGEDRVDTVVMSSIKGKFISKIGGEAIFGMGLVNEKISFAIKIEDGANRPMIPSIIRTLEVLGIDVENTPELKKLKTFKITNNAGLEVGLVNPIFDFK